MLTLVAPGPKLIAVRAAQQQVMVQYLTAHFMCEPMEQLGMGINTTKTLCVLCVIDEQAWAWPSLPNMCCAVCWMEMGSR